MEINQKPHTHVQQAEMGEQLGFVNWVQRILAFEFYHHRRIDHQIRSKAAVHLYAIEDNRNRLLPFNSPAKSLKFVRKAGFVCGFEQARSKAAMDFDRGSDDFVTDVTGHIKIMLTRLAVET